jgi:hypothetical protein
MGLKFKHQLAISVVIIDNNPLHLRDSYPKVLHRQDVHAPQNRTGIRIIRTRMHYQV